jgi:hypothetical protein
MPILHEFDDIDTSGSSRLIGLVLRDIQTSATSALPVDDPGDLVSKHVHNDL